VLVTGKPADSMMRLRRADGLAFLPIPYNSALSADFLPAELSHEDYPDMIPEGQSIKTVADGAVLIAYNWQKDSDRYRRVDMFVNAFFSRIAEFQKPPHHVKWREVNLNSSIEGWNRLESAQRWLDNHFNTAGNTAALAQARDLASTSSDAALFKEFLEWKRTRQAH